jgi:hypothetical protein
MRATTKVRFGKVRARRAGQRYVSNSACPSCLRRGAKPHSPTPSFWASPVSSTHEPRAGVCVEPLVRFVYTQVHASLSSQPT